MVEERLQKTLARAGVASRRAAEQLIIAGRVRVNDAVIKALGTKVNPEKDEVRVDGRRVQVTSPQAQEKVYFLLNKPPAVLTTTKDDRGRRTVMDLVVGASLARIYPVGRLDYDAEGALLLTNDGELANLLTHPRYHVPKTYMAKVNTWVEITVTEGRNRLIKRMFWRIQHPVLKLVRTRFGSLTTDGLRPGDYRSLSSKELVELRSFIA